LGYFRRYQFKKEGRYEHAGKTDGTSDNAENAGCFEY
jgi:hypothetical protein